MEYRDKYPIWIKMFEVDSKKSKMKLFEESIVWNLNIDLGIEFIGDNVTASYVKWLHKSKQLGTIEYFPKSDKVHIHSQGVDGWKDSGLRWIYDNLK